MQGGLLPLVKDILMPLACSEPDSVSIKKFAKNIPVLSVLRYGESLSTFIKPGEKQNEILKTMQQRITAIGPVTVFDYMKEVLTNPSKGYYMTSDVFGKDGDFITSPEISQMFGEMIGIWFVNEWQRTRYSTPIQYVELGPGRGTLADDILRVFKKFPEINESLSLHMVEISPGLAQIQIEKLSGQKMSDEQITNLKESYSQGKSLAETDQCDETAKHYYHCKTRYGQTVYWYRDLNDVPSTQYSFYMAHEFFDALPICKFQKTPDKGWCEVLIDINPDKGSSNQFQFVLSPGATLNSTAYLKYLRSDDKRDHVEISPYSAVIIQQISERIKRTGGSCLIVDYGHNGNKTDTFRGFKNHKLHDVLCDPGTADLTADVDFSLFCHICSNTKGILTFGPITQGEFLRNIGIQVRLQMLLKNKDDEAKKNLISGYDMITNPQKMGQRFKCFAMLQKGDSEYVPAGFDNVHFEPHSNK